jgi:hypothetical protein
VKVSLCKHGFPVQPPLGSLAHPGDCSGCGLTWAAAQAELRKQEEALIVGAAHDGQCPDCRRSKRLFRWQPADRPWHEIGHQQPVTFLCTDCWNGATDADNAFADALIDAI